MIATVWKIGWLNLLRDRPALALTFLMPLFFFSIFALVFGEMDRQGPAPVAVAVVYEAPADRAGVGGRLEELLAAEEGIELRPARGRAGAVEEIRAGRLTAAVLVPAGLTARLAGAPE
ncbi:MAG: hypothetical protein R3325_08510, partial [Thermoanaerobaculia bacterium]|nr:hypothetical protein [Thermoanaerobaculia bacterium]